MRSVEETEEKSPLLFDTIEKGDNFIKNGRFSSFKNKTVI